MTAWDTASLVIIAALAAWVMLVVYRDHRNDREDESS